jgi:hypothetical protein
MPAPPLPHSSPYSPPRQAPGQPFPSLPFSLSSLLSFFSRVLVKKRQFDCTASPCSYHPLPPRRLSLLSLTHTQTNKPGSSEFSRASFRNPCGQKLLASSLSTLHFLHLYNPKFVCFPSVLANCQEQKSELSPVTKTSLVRPRGVPGRLSARLLERAS